MTSAGQAARSTALVSQPPVTEPPVTEPPVTEPPGTEHRTAARAAARELITPGRLAEFFAPTSIAMVGAFTAYGGPQHTTAGFCSIRRHSQRTAWRTVSTTRSAVTATGG